MNSPADTPKDTAPRKVEARLPRGFGDRGPAELAAMRGMLEKIRTTFELYGFEAVETPFIEYTEALGKFLPDLDRPNEGVFSFQDDDDQWLSLRYDLTAPLARYVAEHFDALPKPYRSYRNGYVFRNEKPGPGRFRQFMQFDADTVGAPGVSADAEMCMLMADTLEAVGIKRGDYVIKVNNRKVLDGVMEAIGLAGDENAARRLIVLRAIDKLDRLGTEGVAALLGAGRKDESGDFTKGAGLEAKAIETILAFTSAKAESAAETMANLAVVVSGSAIGAEGVSELAEIASLVTAGGYEDGRVVIDPSVVRGLEYYTGPVFEAELTFEVKGDDGKPVRFGSVAGGGRYDGLVARFRGEPVPATGFSVGVSRLLSALSILGKLGGQAEAKGPVVVLVMDKDQIAHYQRLVSTLRQAGIKAELYLGGSGMKAQMKYADKRGSVCVVIQGSDEREKGEVLIKDLVLGATLSSAPDRDAYLKQQAEAQFAVSEGDMIAAVGKVLARHR
ncbi:MAG: histidine--tRNA ligase [Alphaproteobacteria bacterium]|nr:histidine--tRNA ligase [Beijerinckiaceae bacterium]NBQ39022.1 histidine--tRNA ligase [Alphaproteobacteria bacterium]